MTLPIQELQNRLWATADQLKTQEGHEALLRISLNALIKPHHLYSRYEVLSKPSPVPTVSRIYAWYFLEVPGITPTGQCITSGNKTLLYIGISPDKAGKPNSSQNLRKRIYTHYRGNAEGSTLRRTPGILLAQKIGFPLRRVESGKRMTLTHLGEQWLDKWMEQNAFVCWPAHPSPWDVENKIMGGTHVPLNILYNESHPFSTALKALRKEALVHARPLPIAIEVPGARAS